MLSTLAAETFALNKHWKLKLSQRRFPINTLSLEDAWMWLLPMPNLHLPFTHAGTPRNETPRVCELNHFHILYTWKLVLFFYPLLIHDSSFNVCVLFNISFIFHVCMMFMHYTYFPLLFSTSSYLVLSVFSSLASYFCRCYFSSFTALIFLGRTAEMLG